MKTKIKGFTLIELLVVIAIISLLSSVILAAVKDTRDKARQTAYRQYLGEVVKAVELYRIGGGNVDEFVSGGSTLDSVIDSKLGNFIKKGEQPSFVIGLPGFGPTSSLSTYNCGGNNQSDYYIVFESTRDDLNFTHLYDGTTPLDMAYCVSPSRN